MRPHHTLSQPAPTPNQCVGSRNTSFRNTNPACAKQPRSTDAERGRPTHISYRSPTVTYPPLKTGHPDHVARHPPPSQPPPPSSHATTATATARPTHTPFTQVPPPAASTLPSSPPPRRRRHPSSQLRDPPPARHRHGHPAARRGHRGGRRRHVRGGPAAAHGTWGGHAPACQRCRRPRARRRVRLGVGKGECPKELPSCHRRCDTPTPARAAATAKHRGWRGRAGLAWRDTRTFPTATVATAAMSAIGQVQE